MHGKSRAGLLFAAAMAAIASNKGAYGCEEELMPTSYYPPRNKTNSDKPHQGTKEKARRLKQLNKGVNS